VGADVAIAPGLSAAVADADAVVITTPLPEIAALSASLFARPSVPLPVIDPWGILRGSAIADVANVILLGRGGPVRPLAAVGVYTGSHGG